MRIDDRHSDILWNRQTRPQIVHCRLETVRSRARVARSYAAPESFDTGDPDPWTRPWTLTFPVTRKDDRMTSPGASGVDASPRRGGRARVRLE